MRHRHRTKLGAALVVVALVLALALVVNPELRALLLFTDSLGLDLVALLLVTQLRFLTYALLPVANTTISSLCGLAFWIGSGAIRTLPNVLSWRPFDKLFCPVLVFVTYGIRCVGE